MLRANTNYLSASCCLLGFTHGVYEIVKIKIIPLKVWALKNYKIFLQMDLCHSQDTKQKHYLRHVYSITDNKVKLAQVIRNIYMYTQKAGLPEQQNSSEGKRAWVY